MGRSNKHGLTSRMLKGKCKKKKRIPWQYRKLRKITLNQGLSEGVLIQKNGTVWFRKGRKVNWFTRKKYGPNGETFYMQLSTTNGGS